MIFMLTMIIMIMLAMIISIMLTIIIWIMLAMMQIIVELEGLTYGHQLEPLHRINIAKGQSLNYQHKRDATVQQRDIGIYHIKQHLPLMKIETLAPPKSCG